MAYIRPTLTELIDRVIADISSRITGVDGAVLRKSLLGVIGRAEAGAIHMLYGYIDWVAKQVIPDTAEKEYLERWCAIWGIARKTSSFSTGTALLLGTPGRPVPAGTVLQRQDGVQYTTLSEGEFTGTTLSLAVTATVAGVDGNAAAGTAVFLLSPISGVQSSASLQVAAVGGEDVESDERLLARLLERIRKPPQGGAESDYVTWALEVAGVTRVWVYPRQMGAGTVTVLFVCDDTEDIIPTPSKVAEVQAHLEAKRPVTAEVFGAAPIEAPLNPSIKLRPNTVAVQAAVRDELQDMLSRDALPGGTILISRIREAVSLAAGEDDNAVLSPMADVPNATGHFATLGTITFSSL